ncbi:MAG: ion transporter [Nitratireductor sp.]
MKKRLADIIWGQDPFYGQAFDHAMIALILAVTILMSVETLPDFPVQWTRRLVIFDWIVIVVFTAEYGIRLWTASNRLRYGLSLWGLIDFIAIAPFWTGFILGIPGTEALWSLRLLRIAKLVRFVSGMQTLRRAYELVWRELLMVFMFALLVMYCTAIGIYFFEHESQPTAFPSIPHSFWFAVTTLTTVGYGDTYPVTTGGKLFTFVILMIGLGIVALPAGLIASAFTQARQEEKLRQANLKAEREAARRASAEATALSSDIDG